MEHRLLQWLLVVTQGSEVYLRKEGAFIVQHTGPGCVASGAN